MARGLPPQVTRPLVAPDAWVRGDEAFDPAVGGARGLLLTLWQVVAGSLPTGLPRDEFVLAVVRSTRVRMSVVARPGGGFLLTITDSLLRALDTYARAWVAQDDPGTLLPDRGASPAGARKLARDVVLGMAWSYKYRGRLYSRRLPLDEAGSAAADAHAAGGLVFLLAHELAHATAGHLDRKGTPAACLTVTDVHREETEADLLAAAFLAANPLAVTATGTSVRILFEMLELVALGAPDDTQSHPLSVRRLLTVLAALDPVEHRRLLADLRAGASRFWLLSGTARR